VGRAVERGTPIQTAAQVEDCLRARLVDLEHEELHVLGLDTHNRVLTHFVAAVGTLNQVYACPRDVFRPLVREAAHRAIVVHNHPSGDSLPSEGDDELTARLAEAGELMGIDLLDHVVLARAGPFSFAEAGRLPRRTTV
jgi:DNA repair protein RadC